MRAALVCLGLCALNYSASGQQPVTVSPQPVPVQGPVPQTARKRVDLSNTYHRVLAIVPLVGSGTHADPMRPMFAPTPSASLPDRTGIIAWQHQVSDDGTLAIVEFVAPSRAAFAPLFASTDPRVQVFEVGQHAQAEVQAAFQQVKTSFSFSTFVPLRVP